ncbi:hypothetical protein AB0I60_33300 [Actinosynnema sp. NPDC050436]
MTAPEQTRGPLRDAALGVVNDLRTWFPVLAFVGIGLEFRVGALKQAGW